MLLRFPIAQYSDRPRIMELIVESGLALQPDSAVVQVN